MALQNLSELLECDWFKDQFDTEDLKSIESNFKSSTRTQQALVCFIDHELSRLDNELSFTKLKSIPDRAEVALMVVAQKDALQRIKNLLVEDTHTNGV